MTVERPFLPPAPQTDNKPVRVISASQSDSAGTSTHVEEVLVGALLVALAVEQPPEVEQRVRIGGYQAQHLHVPDNGGRGKPVELVRLWADTRQAVGSCNFNELIQVFKEANNYNKL